LAIFTHLFDHFLYLLFTFLLNTYRHILQDNIFFMQSGQIWNFIWSEKGFFIWTGRLSKGSIDRMDLKLQAQGMRQIH
jgi:hypothetical protein